MRRIFWFLLSALLASAVAAPAASAAVDGLRWN